MSHALATIGLYLVLGQLQSTPAAAEKVATAVTVPADAVGQRCVVALHSDSPASTIQNGKVVRFDDTTVVLAECTEIGRVEKSVWLLGRMPGLGRLFTNVGYSVKEVPGEVTIARRDIKSLELDK